MEKKKHFCINCSLTKVQGNIGAVYEYLVDHRFITECEGMPDGMLPYGSPIGAVAYAFRNGVRLETDAENGEFFSASAPVNADGDYIMLLVNANATDTPEEYGIMRRALCAYVATLAPASPIVLHLDGWLLDAFQENGEEHALPGGDNVEVVDTPAEPVETAKNTDGKPTFASLMDDFTRRQNEIVSRTPEGEDWFVEFNEVASPREIVGYYLYTYGLSGTTALDKWKANTKGTVKTKTDNDVDEIFDAIFCPFCEQRKEMAFGSQACHLQLDTDGTVDCYCGGKFQGAFAFPNCPACGKPIEAK